MSRQESKYQAYIIDQMNDKNKLVAAAKIQGILTREVNRVNSNVLQALYQLKGQELLNQSASRHSCSNIHEKDENVSVNFLLVKLSLNAIKRATVKIATNKMRDAFANFSHFSKKKKLLDRTSKIINTVNLRHAFRKLASYELRQNNQLET